MNNDQRKDKNFMKDFVLEEKFRCASLYHTLLCDEFVVVVVGCHSYVLVLLLKCFEMKALVNELRATQ